MEYDAWFTARLKNWHVLMSMRKQALHKLMCSVWPLGRQNTYTKHQLVEIILDCRGWSWDRAPQRRG